MMATATGDRRADSRTVSAQLTWLLAVASVLALTVWAVTADRREEGGQKHPSPSTVTAVDGSDFALVSLTAHGAQRIGLETSRVEPAAHPAGTLAVPYSALVYGADGSTWVYATDGSALQFRRQVVEVATVAEDRAILVRGPEVGAEIVAVGVAELYGTEFEIGH